MIVALLMSFTFMSYVNRLGMSNAGSEIRAMYQLSETQFGTVISAFNLAYTLCMIPGGWLSDRWGARAALASVGLGTAVFAAASGLLGWIVPSAMAIAMLVLLWTSRAAMGALTAPLFPAAGRVVSHWVPFHQRARINALVTGAAMLGMALSHPICGALFDRVGWPAALMLLALATGLLGVVWVVCGRDAPAARPEPAQLPAHIRPSLDGARSGRATDSPSRSVLSNRSLWLLTICYASMGYVEYVIFYWSADYFKKVLHLSEWGERVAAMAPPLCMAVCMPLGGWLCDWLMPLVGYRRCRAVVAVSGMVGSAIFLTLATVVESDILIVACFSLSLAMMGLAEAPAWATAIDLGGRQPASSAALANTGGNFGGTLSPTVTPWISALLVSQFQFSDQAGWGWGLRVAALVGLVGSVLWIWIDAGERR